MRASCWKTLLPGLSRSSLLIACACAPDTTGGVPPGAATGTGATTSAGAASSEEGADTEMTAADSESSGGEAGVCGNGIIEAGEDCDGSGESATCNDNCTTVVCGDGIANTTAGEDCDDAANGDDDDGCTDACLSPACGDGTIQVSQGEECDDSGDSLSCNVACLFKSWGDPTLLGPHTSSGEGPRVAVHANGNAMAVWRTGSREGPVRSAAARYDGSSDSWGGLVLFGKTEIYGSTAIAMDDSENVIAVWADNAAPASAYAARYDAATDNWSDAQLLETEAGGVLGVRIAVAGNGDAVAVWAQTEPTNRVSIYASRYSEAADTWTPRDLLQLTTDTTSSRPSVAIDGNGNAIVVWRMLDGPWYSTYSSRYSVLAASWSDPVALENGAIGDTTRVEIAVGETGNAIALWHKSDGTRINLHSARYDVVGNVWGDSFLLENDDVDILESRIAIDPDGNAVAVWTHTTALVAYSRARHYDGQTASWGSAVTISEDCIVSSLVLGAIGNGVISCIAVGAAPMFSAQAIRYDATDQTWSPAESLGISEQITTNPEIGIADSGNFVAAWRQAEGADVTAMASVFN